MTVKEKVRMSKAEFIEKGPITIVAFGDSVTHGAVGHNLDFEAVYWRKLAQMINAKWRYIPVNVINAGIGGLTATNSLPRMDSQVLSHSPDLVIVCFGLNDVNGTLEDYISALKEIFGKCVSRGIETIYMTPNMLNTYVSANVRPENIKYAHVTAEYQNSGKMDSFMNEGCKLAREMGIKVCDCYSKWKKLAETEDTTLLLGNGINHPNAEMHKLFAQSLFDVIFDETDDVTAKAHQSIMYENK